MPELEKQKEQWEQYWSATRTIAKSSVEDARSIWDSDPESGAELDLPRFKEYFDLSLPVLDVGCGNGTQTARLAKYFPKVIGTDVSANAVELARQINGAPNLTYDVLNALSLEDAQAFQKRHGDVNLYVRTVVHQFGHEDRMTLARTLKTLMGKRGAMYVLELGPRSPAYFEAWIAENGMPHKLERVLSSGARPGPVGRSDVDAMFPPEEYELIKDGEVFMPGARMSSAKLDAEGRPEGAPWDPPMYFAVIVPRRTKH